MFVCLLSFSVWAEHGEFRDNTHSVMTSVAGSMDHTQLNFPTTNTRNRNNNNNNNRDRKNDGKLYETEQQYTKSKRLDKKKW